MVPSFSLILIYLLLGMKSTYLHDDPALGLVTYSMASQHPYSMGQLTGW